MRFRLARQSVLIFLWAMGLLFSSPPFRAHGQCAEEISKLLASDAGTDDEFGFSVSVSGDTALIGAYWDDDAGSQAGAAYVFVRSGSTWTQQAKLTASDAGAGDQFGFSVSIDGDTALIGADHEDHTGGADAGAAYVFVRMDGVWSQQARLTAPDAAAADLFGWSVALSGDTAVIGARQDTHAGGNQAGSAYVFTRCSTVWSQQQKLTALDAALDDEFGWSVAISGNTAVIGADNDDHAGGSDAGAAYIFARAGTIWLQTQKLTASDAAAGDLFGWSVAISGDTVVVGARADDNAGGGDAGSAYAFVRSGAVWVQQAMLTASDAGLNDWFGNAVALSDDTAVIGAHFNNDAGSNSGSAYMFTRSGGVWTQQAKLTASDAATNDEFGKSVAVSGTTALIGSHQDDHAGVTDSGSVYHFEVVCDEDGDGVPDTEDVCPGSDPALPVCDNGRPQRDCNNDCLVNGLDVACITAEMLE